MLNKKIRDHVCAFLLLFSQFTNKCMVSMKSDISCMIKILLMYIGTYMSSHLCRQ